MGKLHFSAGWLAGLLVVTGLLFPQTAAAENPSGDLAIELIVAYNLVVDSNIETPAGRSPTAGFIGVKFCNVGTDTLYNVIGYSGNFESNTPGIYPVTWTNKPGPGLYPFSLTHESGTPPPSSYPGAATNADATRYLGDLLPGECRTVYWLVSYPLLDSEGNAVFDPLSVNPGDDLQLFYDIWGTAESGGSIVTADTGGQFTLRNEITASANKILPNNANKVPQEYLDLLQKYVPQWTNTPYDGTVGTRIFTEGYWYDLGVINQGFDNDGDLVPDYNAWMQPVGDAARFNSACFRLVKTYAMVVVKLIPSGEQVYIVEDQLYFENVPENSGAIGLVLYEFMPLVGDCYSQLTPYQEVASGYDNEKFNADFGAGFGLYSGTSTVEIVKGASEWTVIPGSNISYYVSFTNYGNHTVGSLELSSPIVIHDRIPDGTYYVPGSATNYSVVPTNLPYYIILYSTNNGVSWMASEPTNPTNVTDIQWWLPGGLESNASGQVGFDVQVDPNYTNSDPYICNWACISYGNSDPFDCDEVCTLVEGNNSLGDTVWADDGAGGGFSGNQIQDGAEPGISNITVWLYRDVNADGILDGADRLLGTNSTGAAGYYMFTNLLDGAYIAVVDWLDPDLPYGYTLTTPESHWAALDPDRTNSLPVVYTNADFGFAPALTMDKALMGSSNVYEGQTVTFQITVTNDLQGTGGPDGGARIYDVWANAQDVSNDKASGSGTGNKAWNNITNAWIPPYPDGVSCVGPFDNAGEMLALMDFRLGYQVGSVTSVYVVLPVLQIVGTFGSDTFEVHLWKNGVELWSTSILASTISVGDLMFDVTAATGWTWQDFNSTNVTIKCITQKAGNPNVELHIDCFGFRVWGDGEWEDPLASTILNPVPLTDLYPTNVLKYLSADPLPTVVDEGTSPFGTLYWDNVGPIYPGGASTVMVYFTALEPPGNIALTETNYAIVTNATFMNGIPANSATDEVPVLIRPAGSIGDYVWRDYNRNGIQDDGTSNEVGIGNVRVILYPPTTNIDVGAGAGVPKTNLTDQYGWYLFDGLYSGGSYTVRVDTASLPGSWTNTCDEDSGTNAPNNQTVVTNMYPTSTVWSVQNHVTADFGYILPSLIDGHVWHDRNWSATDSPDDGEEWITNVVVWLYTNLSSAAIATNYTDVNGYFLFTGNYSGTYYVVVSTNSGALTNGTWYQTFDSDGTGTAHQVTVTVPLGGQGHADYSYVQVGAYAIGDTVFYDWDGNGVQDTNTEEGIFDIPVNLYLDRDGDGVVDYGYDLLLASTNTTSTGYYIFTNVPPTNYLVIVDESVTQFPPDHVCTADPYGAMDGRSALAITTSNNYVQDFGYQPYGCGAIGDWVWYDADGDGEQDVYEDGIADITVSLYVDANRDGTYVLRSSAVTDSTGWYLFTNLADSLYRVVVDTGDSDLPTDALDHVATPTTVTNHDIEIVNSSTNLTADFGFVLPGVLGDTVYWDYNENGTQDWNEDGATNVTVQLYYDANNDGAYDGGDVLLQTTSTDSNGIYHFTGLWPSNYLVYVVPTGTLDGAYLSADPDNDGWPCSHPLVTNCDGAYGYDLDFGEIFLGADFGYVPPGVIGDLVWIDQNDNGLRDSGEQGIPWITVLLYSNGTVVATTETDPDGWYAFGNLLDGTYSVSVDVHDVDFPTNVFPGLYANYDYDGVYDSRTTNIIISVGVVTQISGISCTECNTNVDFGYRFPGTNILSGTVGLDGTPFDGRMGTNGYGYATNEAPFAGVTLYLKLWNDDGDGVVEAGEYIDLMTTQTDTNGDYSFTHLPEGDGDDRYIVSLAAPREHLIMTTTNGSTEPPVLWVTNNVNVYGETRSAYQVMDIQPVTTNIDFAFTLAMEYDFGDLPVSYSTRIQDMPAGPQSQVLLTTNLYLGAVVDTEFNGQPSADATGDGGDEEGVGLVPSVVWQDGADGGQVSVVVGGIGDGSAWLTGYIDFNQNGSFLDSGDMVVSEAISAIGTYTYSFNVPSGSIQAFTSTVLYARFRIFPDKPFIPELAYVTTADNGEIEDYRWVLGSVSDQVWEDANSNNVYDLGEVRLTNVTVYADLNTNGVHDAGEPYMVTDTPDGRYGIGGFPDGTYPIRVDTNTGALAGSDYYATYDLDGGYDSAALVTLSGGEVNTNVDFGYRSPGSTYVLLQRLDVTVDDGQVVVEWETAGEVGTAGFYLLRQDQEGGAFVPVNKELLTALLDAPQGGIYRVVDPSAKPGGTYAYQINEVEFGGRINTHGPFPVTLPEAVGSASGARRDKSTVKQFFERTARVSEFARARRAAVKPAKAPIARSLSAEPAVKLESGAVVQPLKIRVGAGGVYFVDMALLADYLGGVSPERIIASVTGGGIRMTRRGQECRYLATSAGVYFYAEAVDSLYTTNDVYWLHWTPGTLAGSLAGTGPSPLADTVFMDTLHAEQDVAESTALTTNPASDYWGWNYMSAASSKLQTRVFPLYPKSVAVSEAPATLVSHLLGATTTATQREHHVRIALNGTPIGEAWWEGMVPVSLTNSFSQALLADGSNSVAVTALLDPGIKYSIVVADSFDLSYQRRYQAVDDQLLVRGDANPVISVTGFSEPQVRVLNVGDPHKPVLLKGVTVDAFGGGYRASFRPSGPAVPYQLFTLGSAKAPVSVVMDEPSSLRSAVNGAEYIVITVPELAAEAQVLADYRAGKGLQTMTVLLDDIYDEFNHGIPEAPAIRSFLAYASANWAVPPRYVLLAGEGTYDYRNCRGAGDNRIPTMMASTPHGIAESDSWYGDVDDDGVPDIAVGRLPALDATELNALVSRIIAYEEGEGGAWKQTMVLAADNPDHGGNFEGSSEEVEGFLPRDYGVQKVYLSEHTPAEAKTLFLDALNRGSAFVNFYGHGGMDVMTGEGLLKSTDAGALTNAPRLPVVVSLSCLLGRHGVPNFDCLSEALMLSGGGAIAAWSPSGQSYNRAAVKLADGFYTAVFHEGIGILGDAILRAMQMYDDPKRMWMLMIYNLLGDPAMELQGTAFMGLAATLENWEAGVFSAGQLGDPNYSAFDADPDGDDVVNLLEYAFGWNPHAADGDARLNVQRSWQVGTLVLEGSDASISYQRRKSAGDVEFRLMASLDLATWNPANQYVTETTVTDDGNGLTETVRIHLSLPPELTGSALYVRLRVTKQ